jgi:hypothetical protein
MALDQNEIQNTEKMSDHELVAGDFIKKSPGEPSDDFYEFVMIDSILRQAHDDLWKEQ